MRQSKKRALWIAAGCVVAGVVILVVLLAVLRFDFSRLDTGKFVTNTYEISDPFTDLEVRVASSAVRLAPSADGSCTVVCIEEENNLHTVSVEGDTLRITSTDQRHWYEHVGISWGGLDEPSVTLYLPEDVYQTLSLNTASGAISVPADFTFAQASLDTVSGDVSFFGTVTGRLLAKTTSGEMEISGRIDGALSASSTSGEISLHDVQADSLTVQTSSGEIELRDAAVAHELTLSSVSSEITLETVTAAETSISSTSGALSLSALLTDGHAALETVSSEIHLSASDAQTLWIKSVSGEISGTLCSDKDFQAQTTSGELRVPSSVAGAGVCEMITTSGDISISIRA